MTSRLEDYSCPWSNIQLPPPEVSAADMMIARAASGNLSAHSDSVSSGDSSLNRGPTRDTTGRRAAAAHNKYTSQPRPQIVRPARERGVDHPPTKPPQTNHHHKNNLPPSKPHRAASRDKSSCKQDQEHARGDAQSKTCTRNVSENSSKRSYFELDVASLEGSSQHSKVSSITNTSNGECKPNNTTHAAWGVLNDSYSHDEKDRPADSQERRFSHEYLLDDSDHPSGNDHDHDHPPPQSCRLLEDHRWSDRSHYSACSRPEWTHGVVDDVPRKPTRTKVYGYEQDYLDDEEAYQAHILGLLGGSRGSQSEHASDPLPATHQPPNQVKHKSSHSLQHVLVSRERRRIVTKQDPLLKEPARPLVQDVVYRTTLSPAASPPPPNPPYSSQARLLADEAHLYPGECQPVFHTKNNKTKSQKNEVFIEVYPGHSVPLRGRDETVEAISQEFYVPATCFACSQSMFCIANAQLVLCPACKSVNPLVLDFCDWPQHGAGLGITPETLAQMRAERYQNSTSNDRGIAKAKRNTVNTEASYRPSSRW